MVLIIVTLVEQHIVIPWTLLLVHLNQVILGMEHCVLTVINVLMVLIIVILVMQCVLIESALLPTRVNQVMLGMEHCVLTLINVLMLFIIVILVVQCVLMLRALTCLFKCSYAKDGTLCTDTDECADGTHICHPGLSCNVY